MSKEILINVEAFQEKRLAIIENGFLNEYFIERPSEKTIVGNIYKGRIDSVVPSVSAAFVDIGQEKNGFLYTQDILDLSDFLQVSKGLDPIELKSGEEILVQVVKEPFATKGARLTTHISLAGRYLVLMPQDASLGISKRIEGEAERKRLNAMLQELKLPKDMGLVMRTACVKHAKKEIARELSILLKFWHRIQKISSRMKAPSLVYEDYDMVLKVLRDSFRDDVSCLWVDSKQEFARINKFAKNFMQDMQKKIKFYTKDLPLFEHNKIESQIEKLFHSKVYLKSGAYIIIEPTEGLVVVDVNSGHFKKKNLKQEEAVFIINKEAAIEIARQLRLRDLGGIIVIDFIDMEREKHRRGVLKIFNDVLRQDRAKTDILGISKIGLVEMTRERVLKTVESISYQTCPYCNGRGKVKSAVTMSIKVVKEIKVILSKNKFLELNVMLHPNVAEFISKNSLNSLKSLERRFRTRIVIGSNPNLHFEDIKVL
ncbi:MAG: Rne/Rng family ribonuclease [Candidatus Gygaella obscura]|nr:Rne/Rng family ribonuclease [Candidatus Gygaella obscura]